MNLQSQIKQMATRHENLYHQFVAQDEVELAIHHRQFSNELFGLIIDRSEAALPTWFECHNCGRINAFDRAYCACGHPVDWM